MDYGLFLSLEDGLEGLCHQSELSHSKKNTSAKKMFVISQKVKVVVKEIDLEKRRISLSHKDTIENPWKEFEKKFPQGSKISGKVKNITDFGLFVSIKDCALDGLVHYKDLSYSETDEDLKNFNKNQDLELKVLEINSQKEKIRLGLKQLMPDPLEYFKGKNKKDIITVTVKEISDTGIKVSPDECNLKFLIKKNQIAIDYSNELLDKYPDDPDLYYNVGVLYQRLTIEIFEPTRDLFLQTTTESDPSSITGIYKSFKTARKYAYNAKDYFLQASDLELDESISTKEAVSEMRKLMDQIDEIFIPSIRETARTAGLELE